jgi:DNA-binding transcriptional MerR regulator
VDEDWMTIAEAAARCGLPESTLRYWERIGLVNRVQRDPSSGHRRYRPGDVATLETLGKAGDLDKAAAVAEELAPIIRRMNPKDNA